MRRHSAALPNTKLRSLRRCRLLIFWKGLTPLLLFKLLLTRLKKPRPSAMLLAAVLFLAAAGRSAAFCVAPCGGIGAAHQGLQAACVFSSFFCFARNASAFFFFNFSCSQARGDWEERGGLSRGCAGCGAVVD